MQTEILQLSGHSHFSLSNTQFFWHQVFINSIADISESSVSSEVGKWLRGQA